MPPWPPAVATVADAPRARAVADPLKYVIFERYRRKDDYTGEGLERRQDAILSPRGISKEDLERRAQDFAAGR